MTHATITHQAEPCNREPARCAGDDITPLEQVFLRNNHPAPTLAPDTWQLRIDGLVARALTLDYGALRRYPLHYVASVLECAGNHRAAFATAGQPADGVPWRGGAVANVIWGGVAVADLFDDAGVAAAALQAECHSGADFARGVEVAALREQGMLALYANGVPLPSHLGGPVRLVVPGWYAINAVKWLSRMTVIDHESASPYNQQSYVLYDETGTPYGKVRELQVKSLITSQHHRAGWQDIRGVAWSDGSPIRRVSVAIDDEPWRDALLHAPAGRYAWRGWSLRVAIGPGRHRLRCRATDAAGRTQPDRARSNLRGYLMNACVSYDIDVR